MNAEVQTGPTLRNARTILKRIVERFPEAMEDCDQLDMLCQAFLTPTRDPEFDGLTPSGYRIAELLKHHLGRPVSNDQLVNAVYFDRNYEIENQYNVIKQQVMRVRRKLQGRYLITTIFGVGLKMTRVIP